MTTYTKSQFIAHVEECFSGEALEPLYERCAEIQSEICMFGDSGPGSMYHLRQDLDEMRSMARQYKRLTGIDLTGNIPRMPYHLS